MNILEKIDAITSAFVGLTDAITANNTADIAAFSNRFLELGYAVSYASGFPESLRLIPTIGISESLRIIIGLSAIVYRHTIFENKEAINPTASHKKCRESIHIGEKYGIIPVFNKDTALPETVRFQCWSRGNDGAGFAFYPNNGEYSKQCFERIINGEGGVTHNRFYVQDVDITEWLCGKFGLTYAPDLDIFNSDVYQIIYKETFRSKAVW